ncbi:MAG: ACT domain-containing protein [Clostridiales bacterium]|nr:ACT domain-containing protein [Clostridiales bacterium]MCD7826993.1 ACT domain-containing protein [Clostridiales bacterium]
MKAVISVIGKDTVGILASVAAKCAEYDINVMDVTQSVLQDMFVMIMMTDITKMTIPFSKFADEMETLGEQKCLSIKVMHEDIFNAMHTV